MKKASFYLINGLTSLNAEANNQDFMQTFHDIERILSTLKLLFLTFYILFSTSEVLLSTL